MRPSSGGSSRMSNWLGTGLARARRWRRQARQSAPRTAAQACRGTAAAVDSPPCRRQRRAGPGSFARALFAVPVAAACADARVPGSRQHLSRRSQIRVAAESAALAVGRSPRVCRRRWRRPNCCGLAGACAGCRRRRPRLDLALPDLRWCCRRPRQALLLRLRLTVAASWPASGCRGGLPTTFDCLPIGRARRGAALTAAGVASPAPLTTITAAIAADGLATGCAPRLPAVRRRLWPRRGTLEACLWPSAMPPSPPWRILFGRRRSQHSVIGCGAVAAAAGVGRAASSASGDRPGRSRAATATGVTGARRCSRAGDRLVAVPALFAVGMRGVGVEAAVRSRPFGLDRRSHSPRLRGCRCAGARGRRCGVRAVSRKTNVARRSLARRCASVVWSAADPPGVGGLASEARAVKERGEGSARADRLAVGVGTRGGGDSVAPWRDGPALHPAYLGTERPLETTLAQ